MAPAELQALVEKIASLPAERIGEIEDFVDFLVERNRDRRLVGAFAVNSETAFADIWNNPEDDVYDAL